MKTPKLRALIHEEGIIFSFSGLISQSLTSFMNEAVKEQLEELVEDRNTQKAIFLIIAEQLQNIMSYSSNKQVGAGQKNVSPGSLLLAYDKEKAKYYVSSSNEIIEEDKEKISQRIDLVNSMEKSELRKFLREQLRTGENKHDRGAGVGFVEMAKRSSEELIYNFEQIDGKLYFHILTYI